MNTYIFNGRISARFLSAVAILSLLASAFPAPFFNLPEASAANATVTVEVVPNPTGDDDEGEYFTVSYNGAGTLDVENFTVSDQDGVIYTFPDQTLSDGASWTVCPDTHTISGCDDTWSGGGTWVNGTDTLTLNDASDNELLTVSWGSDPGNDVVQSDSFVIDVPDPLEQLGFTSICRVPDGGMRFRVQNTNDTAVEISYQVVGTSDEGDVTVAAAGAGVKKFPSASDGADYTFFETDVQTPAGTTIISYDDGTGTLVELTKAAIDTECEPEDEPVQPLQLTSICRVPDGGMRFRVQNTNDQEVAVDYQVDGTADSGQFTAAAAGAGVKKFPSASDGADYTFFETDVQTGPGTTIITYFDGVEEQQVTKAANNQPCEREPEPITIVAHKLVCDDEADIPNQNNWNGLRPIDNTTAAEWEAQYDSCEFASDWQFEWVRHGEQTDPGDTLVGSAGGNWTTFGPTNPNGMTSVSVPYKDVAGESKLWIREVLQEGYLPFSHQEAGNQNTNDKTAALFCHTDVLNYDNFDRIDDIEAGETYYCVAWNHQLPEPVVCEPEVNVLATRNGGFETPTVTHNKDWNIFSSGIEWLVSWVSPNGSAPDPASLELHAGVNGWVPSEGSQYTELDGDYQGPGGSNGEPASTQISQTIPTVAGETYTLSWDFSARPNTPASDNQLEVYVDGSLVTTNGAAGGGQTDWSSFSHTFTAEEETEIRFKDAGTPNSQGTFLDNVSLKCEPEEPVENTCVIPDDLGDDDPFVIGDSPEKDLQAIIADAGYPGIDVEADETNTQLWQYVSADTDSVMMKVTLLDKLSSMSHAFGYYEGGDASSFVPVFKVGAHSAAVPTLTPGDDIMVTVPATVAGLGFAIDSEGGQPNQWFSEANLNPAGKDSVAVYNPVADTYLVAFEDLAVDKTDEDYNDVVVQIDEIECKEEAEMCTVEAVSDTGTVVVEGQAYAVESFVHPAWTASIPGATWIWDTFVVADSEATTTRTFTETFTVLNAQSATLDVAADNTYRVTINGLEVVDVTEPNNFKDFSQDQYDVSGFLQDGTNTLEIEVTNIPVVDSDPESNPAGLLYKLYVEAENRCELTTYVQPPEVIGNPYCGDGEVNQAWETCDGGAGCTEYCLADNQCHDIGLVKITLDEQAPESVSFDGTIYLGSATNPIPNGTWFKFGEAGDDPMQTVAAATEGLAVERTGSELRVGVQGGNSRTYFDYVFGEIEVLGLDLGTVDRDVVPGWKLEDDGDYIDVFETNANTINMEWYLTTGDDAASIELTPSNTQYGLEVCGDDGGGPEERLYKIEGFVWEDLNENGVRDSEDLLDGWTVVANNGSTTKEVTTDESGYYHFLVPEGTWTVAQVDKANWDQTFPVAGSYTVTVPNAIEVTFFDAVLEYLLPTAHAQTAVETYSGYNFGNKYRGGGGGGSSSGGDPDDSEETETEGEVAGAATTSAPVSQVLGDQVSVVPTGAPNAGAGGASPISIPTPLSTSILLSLLTGRRQYGG